MQVARRKATESAGLRLSFSSTGLVRYYGLIGLDPRSHLHSCMFMLTSGLLLRVGSRLHHAAWLKSLRRSRGSSSSVRAPASFRELCDGCFEGCSSLHCVAFGLSASLERIGVSCLSGVEEVSVPDSVHEPCHLASHGARVFMA